MPHWTKEKEKGKKKERRNTFTSFTQISQLLAQKTISQFSEL